MPNLVDVCVDARGVGVNVAWKPGITESTGPLCVWTVAAGSRQLGLQLAPPVKQRVAGGATVAGCRYDSGYIPIEATNGIIGPWNAFVRAAFAFTQVDTASVGIVKSNWFGFDPLGRVGSGQVQQALLLRGATEVADNVIVANIGVGLIGTTAANIHGNFLGMNFDQTPLGGLNIAIDANGGAIVGPGNRIRGAFGNAVNVTSASPVRITQNSITGNGGGIVSAGPLPQLPPAPTITKVTATDVSGTCSQTGTVEVFTDPGNQGETYVASAPCEAGGSPWAVTAPQALPSGRNVTATLTESTLFRTSGFSKPTAIP